MTSRSFAAVVAGSALLAGGVAAAVQQRIPNAVPFTARPLPLSAVRLTGGPLHQAQQLNAKYLLELEPDRMLAFYRDRAGLPMKGEPLTGWDGDGRQLTGHIAGHYLSAASLMFAATGDPRFKERVDYMVGELKIVQDAHKDGYVGAIKGGKEMFHEVATGNIRSGGFDLNGQWAPWYTLHKTYAGLRDAYRLTGNKAALEVETKFAAWAESIVSKLDDAQMQKMLNTEFGGMPEILADLYADTGDKRWLDLSYRFDHHLILEPFKRQEDKLAGVHGNTTVPKFIAAASRYAYTGKEDDAKAARFFWDRVVNHHTFATGGHGKDEYWREPDKLGRIVDGRTSESCNVYNMLKLTRQLFAFKPSVEQAEFHERALFNHVLGSMDPNDGSTCYMVPVGRSERGKEYGDMKRSFTCCVGSGMESHALHGAGLYYESGDRFWVNIYASSTAVWESAGVNLKADTDFPEGERATFTFTAKSPKSFTLALRRPAWAGEGFAVTVNGAPVKVLQKPPSYVEIKRTWKTGDTVSVTLPKALHLQPTPDMPRRAALMWGPLVLAGDLGPLPERGGRGRGRGEAGAAQTPPPPPPARIETPLLVAADRPLSEWLKPAPGQPGVFRSQGVGKDRDVDFVPFYRLHRRTYTTYFDYFTPAEYEKRKGEIAAERERQRKLDEATVASLQPGEMQPERDFNQQGENTSPVGRIDGRPGRQTAAAGWFSYDLPVDPTRPMALVVTYHRDSRRSRAFQILVDGQKIADVLLDASSEPLFQDFEYPIPADLVKGKAKVTVRFQSVTGGGAVGPVFGVRVIRADAPR